MGFMVVLPAAGSWEKPESEPVDRDWSPGWWAFGLSHIVPGPSLLGPYITCRLYFSPFHS